MNEHDWLDGVFGSVRCANCGAVYGRESIAVVGNRDDYWFVRCTCSACGTQGLGVVIVKRLGETPSLDAPGTATEIVPDENALRVDDVLEAHELLRDYAGDGHGLFERVSGR